MVIAEWKYKDYDDETGITNSYFCSNCNYPQGQVSLNYCAHCGAQMFKEDTRIIKNQEPWTITVKVE